MPELEWNNILITLATVAAACGLIAALWKGAEALGKLTHAAEKKAAEAAQNARLDEVEKRLDACEARLEKGDKQFADTREDMTQTLTVLNAMLMHFISGNDHEKLKGVKESLDIYLSVR